MSYNLTAVLRLNDASFSKGMRNAGRSMQMMKSGVSEVAKHIGILTGVAGAATVAFSSVNKAMDFEAQLSTIKALTGASASEMKSMSDLALDLGKQTKYSALEAAQGIEELLKAGLTPATVKAGGLEAALNLATAGELDLAKAAEIMSTALNAYKDDAMTAAQASDILAGTANASATGVEELQYSLAAVSAVASGVGMTFKDTNIALGLFANNGLKGSDAGTSLKTMLSNLQPKTKAQTEAFFDLGLMAEDGANAFFTAEGKLKSLHEIAGLLQGSMKGLTDQQRMSTLETLFGSDAIRAANILYKEGAGGVKEFNDEMSKVTALEVAKEKMNNAAGAVEQFMGALETLQISVLTPLLPVIKDGATAMADWIENLKPEQIESWGNKIKAGAQAALDLALAIRDNWPLIRETIIGVTAAVVTYRGAMAALTIIGSINTLLTAYRTGTLLATAAQLGLNTALFANPIGLVVAAIAALVAGGILLYRNWDVVKSKTIELWNKMGVLKYGVLALLGPFGSIVSAGVAIYKNFDTIAAKAGSMVNTVISKVNSMIGVLNKIPGVNIPIVPKVSWGNVTSAPQYSKSTGQGRQISAAGGLSYVPRDGTIINAHRGERVLTKQENKEYSSGKGGGNTYNFGGVHLHGTGSTEKDADKLFDLFVKKVEAAGGAGA
ncbi:phage tail tape measure protein [Peribacillus simplex]|uniref:phage tail tape measure protein n=1 Tax=Peribacillus simplex TaxID=1478 RepID=UPI0034E8C9DF